MGCYIWYSEDGPGRAAAPPNPLLAVPNVIAHRSMASVPITVLLYDGPLPCSFNVAIKRLITILPEPSCHNVVSARQHHVSGTVYVTSYDPAVPWIFFGKH